MLPHAGWCCFLGNGPAVVLIVCWCAPQSLRPVSTSTVDCFRNLLLVACAGAGAVHSMPCILSGIRAEWCWRAGTAHLCAALQQQQASLLANSLKRWFVKILSDLGHILGLALFPCCKTCSFVCGLHCRTGGIVCHGNRHPCAAAVSKAVGACVLTQAQ